MDEAVLPTAEHEEDRGTSLLMTSTEVWERMTIVRVSSYSHRRNEVRTDCGNTVFRQQNPRKGHQSK